MTMLVRHAHAAISPLLRTMSLHFIWAFLQRLVIQIAENQSLHPPSRGERRRRRRGRPRRRPRMHRGNLRGGRSGSTLAIAAHARGPGGGSIRPPGWPHGLGRCVRVCGVGGGPVDNGSGQCGQLLPGVAGLPAQHVERLVWGDAAAFGEYSFRLFDQNPAVEGGLGLVDHDALIAGGGLVDQAIAASRPGLERGVSRVRLAPGREWNKLSAPRTWARRRSGRACSARMPASVATGANWQLTDRPGRVFAGDNPRAADGAGRQPASWVAPLARGRSGTGQDAGTGSGEAVRAATYGRGASRRCVASLRRVAVIRSPAGR